MKNAIVTGASNGIGLEISKKLSENDYHVGMIDVDKENLFKESENIKLPSPNTNIIPTSELSELITDGTYYLSCWMTLAQIKQMIETKVMFKDLK